MSTGNGEQSSVNEETQVFASGITCLVCGYDLVGIAHGTCPECGDAVGPYNETIAHERAQFINDVCGKVRKVACLSVACVLVYSIAAGLIMHSWLFGFQTFGSLSGVVLGTVIIVLPILKVVPETDRRMAIALWLRSAWWLHLPWLVLGPVVSAVFFLGVWNRVFDVSILDLLLVTSCFGMVLWFLLLLVSGNKHLETRRKYLPSLAIDFQRAEIVFRVAGFIILIASGSIGAFGGKALLVAIMNMFGQSI